MGNDLFEVVGGAALAPDTVADPCAPEVGANMEIRYLRPVHRPRAAAGYGPARVVVS